MAINVKYYKINTIHAQYGTIITAATSDFATKFPGNVLSVNIAADGRNQAWVKVSGDFSVASPAILDEALPGQQHTDKVLADVYSAGWESA